MRGMGEFGREGRSISGGAWQEGAELWWCGGTIERVVLRVELV